MRVIEAYLPAYEFSETHSIEVATTPENAMAAVAVHRPEDVAFFRFAIALRELPMRLMRGHQSHRLPSFGMDNFTMLERKGDVEVAYGLAGKLWKANYGQAVIADSEAFKNFNSHGCVKLVIGFTCQLVRPGITKITTETRVHCLDKHALTRFRFYWCLIRPVSGLIRQRMLKAIAHQCKPD
ncbi:hypothetical protein [Pseudomonas sp. MWU15-20650]|uniref:hypothetical protein n=1 Tax=Pseudomonas sp. MWU15-20650 TaxID=2933107 RepID=UPI00200CF54B|nr:hypothetical protein [Pseudomonas sp. MWU15-20650]